MSENNKHVGEYNHSSMYPVFAWLFVFVLLAFNLWTFISKYDSFGVTGNAIGTYAAPPVLTTDMIIFISQ